MARTIRREEKLRASRISQQRRSSHRVEDTAIAHMIDKDASALPSTTANGHGSELARAALLAQIFVLNLVAGHAEDLEPAMNRKHAEGK